MNDVGFIKSPYYSIKLASLKKEVDKKIISFSLYGDKNIYNLGALKNVEFAKKYYPGWVCRFYCNEEPSVLEDLSLLDCEFLILDSKIPPMFWRFLTADDPNVSYFCSRDCDSLVNVRESNAVKDWIKKGLMMHLMHDCNGGHGFPVMGGMWGLKNQPNLNIAKMINDFCLGHNYQFRYSQDQTFLAKKILPIYMDSCIDHHSSPAKSKNSYSVPFPNHPKMEECSFVGQRVSPFSCMKEDLSKLNKKSKKVFVLPHLGPGDYKAIEDIVKSYVNEYEEIVIPVKSINKAIVQKLFSYSDKIILKEFKLDDDIYDFFLSNFKNSHRFLGFGMHGKKIDELRYGKLLCSKQNELYQQS